MKKLKLILPMLAIVFAIGLAFAVETNSASQTGYYDDPSIPGIQEVTTSCVRTGTVQCLHSIYPVFADEGLYIPLFVKQP